MLLAEKRSVYYIASDFNRRGVPYLGNSRWDYLAVYNILHPPEILRVSRLWAHVPKALRAHEEIASEGMDYDAWGLRANH